MSSVRRQTHKPKLKLIFNISNVDSSILKSNSRFISLILFKKALWDTTTPFGSPVEPEVNMTNAALDKMPLSGGVFFEMIETPLSI